MMHCQLESESNSTVWVLYTNMEERDLGTANAPLTNEYGFQPLASVNP